MAEMLLFHHAQGLTAGLVAFADELRRAGHTVHTPDLYEGRTFDDLEAGVAHAQETGFDTIIERGERITGELPDRLVYAGVSLGVLPAEKLALTRPNAAGVVLLSGCVPPDAFGSSWPQGLPLQVHGMDGDDLFIDDGDLAAAKALVQGHDDRQLFLYPGDQHLFTDSSLPAYDRSAAQLLTGRVLQLLDAVG